MDIRSSGWFTFQKDPSFPNPFAEAFRQASDFFALSESEKLKLVHTQAPLTRGYTPLGQEHFRSSARPDHKEFFSWGREECGDNIWPEARPEFRKSLTGASEHLDIYAREIFHRTALEAGLALESIEEIVGNVAPLFRLVHYPGPHAEPSGEHADLSLITVIASDSPDGLQISSGGRWMDVPIFKGHAVAMAGEILTILSNGAVPAAVHRVHVHREPRISLTCFLYPRDSFQLGKYGMTKEFIRRRVMELGIHERR